jgi:cytochrome c biogenesis protein CcdA
MLALALLVASIGIADSLNPSTIGPGLYLALGRHGMRRLAGFTGGVFGVYLVGGLALTLGPGRAIPHPGAHGKHLVEGAFGAALVIFAAALWLARGWIARRQLRPERSPAGRSPLLLGAAIMAVELPTAFPYFAAIAAIVAAGRSPIDDVVLLVAFNTAFVSPLVAVLLLRSLSGARVTRSLEAFRSWLQHAAPVLLPALALVAGGALLLAAWAGV